VIDALTGQGIDVRHACPTLSVSESGYYAWKDRPTSPSELRRFWLAGEIVDVHKASGGTYGATRVRAELIHGRGTHVGHNAIEVIMRSLGIKGLPTRRLPRRRKAREDHLARPRWAPWAQDGKDRLEQLRLAKLAEQPARRRRVKR